MSSPYAGITLVPPFHTDVTKSGANKYIRDDMNSTDRSRTDRSRTEGRDPRCQAAERTDREGNDRMKSRITALSRCNERLHGSSCALLYVVFTKKLRVL